MKSIHQQQIIVLSPKQRMDLFEQTGEHICRVQLDSAEGTATIIDRSCAQCLLNDSLPGVRILNNGLCNYCVEYQQQANAGEYSQEKVFSLVEQYRGKDKPDCVVAYSGGKDSAAALLTAIEQYGLRPIAVLVDNGFIPTIVQDSARNFCSHLNVPLLIKTITLTDATANAIKNGFKSIPCQSCIHNIFTQIAHVCEEYKLNLVIGGHRFPPLFFNLSNVTNCPEHNNIIGLSPLLSLGMAEAEQLEKIKQAGWTKFSIAGNTSNCQLIGVIEEMYYDRFGYNLHIYEVSKEIRAGFYSREQGMKKIARPIVTDKHREYVLSKVGLDREEHKSS